MGNEINVNQYESKKYKNKIKYSDFIIVRLNSKRTRKREI